MKHSKVIYLDSSLNGFILKVPNFRTTIINNVMMGNQEIEHFFNLGEEPGIQLYTEDVIIMRSHLNQCPIHILRGTAGRIRARVQKHYLDHMIYNLIKAYDL